jgi:ubiquinone/menaquinone biosynthesis C-methylase UbiE
MIEKKTIVRKVTLSIKGMLRKVLGVDIVRWKPAIPFRRDRIWYQELQFNFQIKPEEKVLDIGSGPTPFPYATILCERFLGETVHRKGEIVRNNLPMLQADIYALPFSEKSIDFIYCAHVLEHLDNPELACKEIIRVGKRGYLETPNYMKDVLFSWAGLMNHRWHTVAVENTLFFFEYTKRQQQGINNSGWSDIIFGDTYHPLQEAFINHQDLFHTMFYWQNDFKIIAYYQKKHD